ncbi:cell division protein FtsL [Methyloligella solikamskensis]|uniref:Cell division protein FtsL n=1 Tax=Methyloligella solikamskensis TaxID=1177756 RepID=A0ABW3JBQ8_9HYPH
MLRFVNICLLLGLVALAYVIYEVKYEARALDHDIAVLHNQIDEERDSIAVLRAEWSLLNRPARIERLAKKFLNLHAANPRQLLTLDTVAQAEFDRKLTVSSPEDEGAPVEPGDDVPDYVKLLQNTDDE